MRNVFSPVPLDVHVLSQAVDAGFVDFEDEIQFHSAIHDDADCFVTRVLMRFGLLALTTGLLVWPLLMSFPITLELSAWYSGIGIAGLVLLIGLTVYAFRTSLAGRPLFGSAALED